jgi:propionyl-CoA synthetase
MKNLYGIEPGEVFWAASDAGWAAGHSYICYAPLLQGATTLIYEGEPAATPGAGAFWCVMAEHQVAAFFTAHDLAILAEIARELGGPPLGR